MFATFCISIPQMPRNQPGLILSKLSCPHQSNTREMKPSQSKRGWCSFSITIRTTASAFCQYTTSKSQTLYYQTCHIVGDLEVAVSVQYSRMCHIRLSSFSIFWFVQIVVCTTNDFLQKWEIPQKFKMANLKIVSIILLLNGTIFYTV